jgi:S-adenosylmethionine/arginine decarboxylase-like enzyme
MHLLINARIMDPPGPDGCDRINALMRGMVEHVRMKVMLDPVTAWCDEPGNEGITSTVILTTSHCVMHIWNLPDSGHGMMQFDLYSCAPFEVDEVYEYLSRHFKILSASYKFLDREHGLANLCEGHLGSDH